MAAQFVPFADQALDGLAVDGVPALALGVDDPQDHRLMPGQIGTAELLFDSHADRIMKGVEQLEKILRSCFPFYGIIDTEIRLLLHAMLPHQTRCH